MHTDPQSKHWRCQICYKFLLSWKGKLQFGLHFMWYFFLEVFEIWNFSSPTKTNSTIFQVLSIYFHIFQVIFKLTLSLSVPFLFFCWNMNKWETFLFLNLNVQLCFLMISAFWIPSVFYILCPANRQQDFIWTWHFSLNILSLNLN